MAAPECPTAFALSVVGGKWRASVLALLKEAPHHHGELRRALPSISQKVLTETLRSLQASGLIHRRPVEHRVEYSLSDRGEQAREALTALFHLGERWQRDP